MCYLSLAPGLSVLHLRRAEPTEQRPLAAEQRFDSLSRPLALDRRACIHLYRVQRNFYFRHTAVGTDGLPLGGDEYRSVSTRDDRQVGDGDGPDLLLPAFRVLVGGFYPVEVVSVL